MSENEALRRWMDENGQTPQSLHRQLEFSQDYIYKLINDYRGVSDAFKWRFAEVFGWDVAISLWPVKEPEHV